jgi:hypothetical protein
MFEVPLNGSVLGVLLMMYVRRSGLSSYSISSALDEPNRASSDSSIRKIESPPVIESLNPILLASGESV